MKAVIVMEWDFGEDQVFVEELLDPIKLVQAVTKEMKPVPMIFACVGDMADRVVATIGTP